MKKVKILLCLFFLFCLLSVIANAGTYGDLTYSISNGEVTITDCDSSATDVVIPETIEGYPVTGFRSEVFCDYTNLESVTIPGSVTHIGTWNFMNCINLKSVTISNGVTYIGWAAFSGCTSLTSIIIPGSVTDIGTDAFKDCTGLENVTILEGVTYIGDQAFYNCTSLKSVTIPEGVTFIGISAFSGCTSLTSVTIPSSVTVIDYHAFKDCTSLESVTIQNGVTYIGGSAFSDCTSLKSVTIPGSITSIAPLSFSRCTSLASVTISNGVTSIDGFSGCTSLASVTIPDSVTSINGFSGCTSLTSVTIPDSVTEIGDYTFYHCTSLKSIIIPNSVTSIGDHALGFYDNDGVEVFSGFTIYGYSNSTAQAYAESNGIPFVDVDKLVSYTGHSLLLDGTIGVKVLLEIDSVVVDVDTLVANVTLKNSDDDTKLVQTLPVYIESEGKTAYTVAYVPPKDADNITVSVEVKHQTVDGESFTYTDIPDVTVLDYIGALKELAKTDEECAKALDLVNALEVYCDYADKYFNESVIDVEEIVLGKSEEDNIKELFSPVRTPDKTIGKLDFHSTSLILEGEITLRHYFKINGEIDFDAYTVEGAEGIKYSENNEGFVFVDVENVYANELADKKTVTISYGENNMTIKFSPVDYVALTYNSDDIKLRNIAKALYRYYVEAKAYTETSKDIIKGENETDGMIW